MIIRIGNVSSIIPKSIATFPNGCF